MITGRMIAWAKQPTTIAGVAAFAGTASALMLQQLAWPQAIPILVGAATSMLLPDNTAAPDAARALAQDAIVLLHAASGPAGSNLAATAEQKDR